MLAPRSAARRQRGCGCAPAHPALHPPSPARPLTVCTPTPYAPRTPPPGVMVEGETFTIEPILTLGLGAVGEWPDGWTSATADRSIAAQFEHAVLVTKDGAECLTAYE
jgi:hypothetical protein